MFELRRWVGRLVFLWVLPVVSAVADPPTPFLASEILGRIRNDYSGFVGMQVQTGSSPISVDALGRIMAPGNSGTHTLKIVNAATGQDVPGATVSVTMTGTSGSFVYASLPSPVTLSANTAYYIVSLETSGGDSWYDLDTRVQSTSAGAVLSAVYEYGSIYITPGASGQSYGPVDFQYGGTSSNPPAITQQPANVTLTVGESAQFTVSASGSGLSYQWQSEPQGAAGFSDIAGATGASYATPATALSDSNTAFQCVVSNNYGSVTSSAATLTVLPLGSGTPFVTSQTLGTPRNDFNGFVGMQVQIGASPITVNALGRMMAPGNNGTHTLKIVNAATGLDVPGGSVSVSMTGTAGSFVYASLPNPVSLSANTIYYIGTLENSGGDQWYNLDTRVQTTNAGAVASAVYQYGSVYYAYGSNQESYGPVNFQYVTGEYTGPVTVSVTPSSATLMASQSQAFSATVTGSTNAGVVWSISPSTEGQVSGSGVYTAPATITSTQTVTVTATSAADPTQSASALVTLSPPNSAQPSNITITFPARNVAVAPNVATIGIDRDECSEIFFIPYIQTSSSLTVSATALSGSVPVGGGVKFVMNQSQPNPLVQYSMAPPYTATFNNLTKGEYQLDSYIVDANQIPLPGSANHDFATNIGVGDIYVAIGDSVTEGYDGIAYDVSPFTDWTMAPVTSNDLRNYPQCGPSTGFYQDHWQEVSHHISLNNELENYFGYPVFFLNEGFAGITSGGYITRMSSTLWQNRINALHPNRWLINLGINDGGGSYVYQTNMQTIINTLENSYGATGSGIDLAVPPIQSYWQPYIDNLISANGLLKGPDFNTFFLNNTNPVLYLGQHPNAAGHLQMARLWALSIMSPTQVAVSQQGSQIHISWNDLRAVEPTIAGYRVYYGTNPTTLTDYVDAGYTTSALISPVGGTQTYYIAVQGYDNDAYVPNLTAASAQVSLVWKPPSVSVVVSPSTITLSSSQSQSFTATVSGSANTAVTWSITPSTTGTISSDGTYNSPASIPFAQTVTVTATSVADPTQSSNAIVNLIPASSATPFLTSEVLGRIRNDYSGFVGMQVQIGSNPISVDAVGRIMAPGNNRTHTLKIVNAATGLDVPGATVSVTMTGTTGNFVYATLPSPVTLSANTAYYVVSLETSGGDLWYDLDTRVQSTNVGAVLSAVYQYNATYITPGSSGQIYGPVDFQYGGTSSNNPPSLTQQPTNVTVTAGQSAQFTVSASGSGLSYQWQSEPSGATSFSDIAGATGASYSTPATALSDNNTAFQCVVSNNYGSVTSSAATLTVQPAGSGTPFVISQTLGALRNDFSGFVGLVVQVGTAPVSVTALGRIMAPGNTGTHTLKVVDASTGADMPGGSVSISLLGGNTGNYVYGTLASPITLNANSLYYVVSLETAGGDQWYDYNTRVETTDAAVLTQAVYYYGALYYTIGPGNQTYGPVNFLYSTGGGSASNVGTAAPHSGSIVF